MLTYTVDDDEAARAQPEMVTELLTAAPASGTVTSVPLVAVHEPAVAVGVDPPPPCPYVAVQ
jgi:hypothetical protein